MESKIGNQTLPTEHVIQKEYVKDNIENPVTLVERIRSIQKERLELTNGSSTRKLSREQYVQFRKKHAAFAGRYPKLFEKIIDGTLDTNSEVFQKMMDVLQRRVDGNITDKHSNVMIGQMVHDKYMKPVLDKANRAKK